MHLNVLLVDDEYLIRDLIKMRLDWEAYGMRIVAEAGNGAQALEMVEIYLPDIVLTDICMPDMDGIEFSRRVAALHPEIKIVIITGHDEFEYARKGLQIGVVDYLLKPIRQQDLARVAKKLARDIEAERHFQRELESLRAAVEANRPVLKERFLTGLIMQPGDAEEVEEQFHFFALPFHAADELEIAVLLVWREEPMNEEHKLMLEAQCVELARKLLPADACQVFVDQ